MTEEIKEILEKPNVYSFNDECYLYFGDYNKLKHYITNLQNEIEKLKDTIKKDNHLLGCNFSKKDKYKQEKDIYKQRNKKALEYIEKYKYDYEVKERGLHMIQSVVPEFRLSEILKGQITKAQCEKLLQGGDE